MRQSPLQQQQQPELDYRMGGGGGGLPPQQQQIPRDPRAADIRNGDPRAAAGGAGAAYPDRARGFGRQEDPRGHMPPAQGGMPMGGRGPQMGGGAPAGPMGGMGMIGMGQQQHIPLQAPPRQGAGGMAPPARGLQQGGYGNAGMQQVPQQNGAPLWQTGRQQPAGPGVGAPRIQTRPSRDGEHPELVPSCPPELHFSSFLSDYRDDDRSSARDTRDRDTRDGRDGRDRDRDARDRDRDGRDGRDGRGRRDVPRARSPARKASRSPPPKRRSPSPIKKVSDRAKAPAQVVSRTSDARYQVY